jgi:hypothetical protein
MEAFIMQRTIAAFLVLLAGSFAYSQHHHGAPTSSATPHHHDAQASSAAAQYNAQMEYAGDPMTVSGYLRDTECLLKNPKAGEANTEETRACLRACVRGGAPLGVLTREGELYTLFGQETPDVQLRSKLEPFAGHYVRVTGWKVIRGGSQGLVIKSVDPEK